ncbi:hypothetical protein [Novosphingopyxis sp.]|uniref:hypothetical protein n=1 Tax=Novosphingopyxis sp. TaxID=2709690 RepID=UPI003B5CAAF9
MTAPVSPEPGLFRAIGESLYGAATAPLRFVLWFLRLLLRLAVPAFAFAAVLHYFAGDVGRISWDLAYLTACGVAFGVLRFFHERFRI